MIYPVKLIIIELIYLCINLSFYIFMTVIFKTLQNKLSTGRFLWMKDFLPLLYSEAVSSSPRTSHLVVNSPSTPTGPRAWILPVEIPTSAPRPSLNPSANLELVLWKTQAESTLCRNLSALS